jgi:3-oxoacyl-[acyl-carrier-protein] synthase II
MSVPTDGNLGKEHRMTRRAVITGLGTVNGLSCNVADFWRRLCAGESGVNTISRFDASPFKVHFGGEVRDFDPAQHMDEKLARRMDRYSQFALVAGIDAVKESGIRFDHEDPSRCGVILGTGIGGMGTFEEETAKYLQAGPRRVSPFLVPKMMPNAAPAALSIQFGLRGPTLSIASACASAADAIAAGVDAIRLNRAEVILAGGSEAALTPMGLSGFCSAKALSERNDEPQRACRPFDLNRDGFVLAEGSGVVVVEELEHARKRGAPIYCEVRGSGQTGDAYHITAPHPEGIGATRAIRLAIADARVNLDDIQYINTHATGTPLGDLAETKAIRAVFGSHADKLVVSSTKSMIGHLCGASGGVAAAVCAMTIRDGVVHPTINYETPDPACNLDCVPNVARQLRVKNILATSFGFGGHNSCLIYSAL